MKKLLLINCSEENIVSDTNKGAEAVGIATITLLRKYLGDVTISSLLGYSEEFARRHNIRLVHLNHSRHIPALFRELGWWAMLLLCLVWKTGRVVFRADWRWLLRGKRLREYRRADALIYVGMDYFTEDAGTRMVLQHARDIRLGELLEKPVIAWAISAGPFRSRLAAAAARSALNRARLITVRDSVSQRFLLDIGINPDLVKLTADPAFAFEGCEKEPIDDILKQAGIARGNHPIIGVNPSHSFIIPSHDREADSSFYLSMMRFFGSVVAGLLPESVFYPLLNGIKRTFLYHSVDRQYTRYKDFFAALVDHLVEEYDATVLLLAHDQAMSQLFDDRIVTEEIKALTRHPDRVVSIGDGYDAAGIKAVIGNCDLFIGARFHAAIAALSQGVPTVCFPYYHKFALVEDLGQGAYISPDYTLEATLPRVREAWSRRKEIKAGLHEMAAAAGSMAEFNGELVRDVLSET